MNFQGESCPNGARGAACLCSTQAHIDKWNNDQQALKNALRHYEPIRTHFYVLAFGFAGLLLWYFVISPQPVHVLPFFICLILAFFAKTWREDIRANEERRSLRKQEYFQLRCAVNFLMTRESPPAKAVTAGEPEDPYPYTTAANKAALEAARVAERTARNREVKRRAKERKAAGIAERRREENATLLRAVVESLKDEQRRRDRIAAEHGWSVHPNDMELDPEEKKKVLAAWEAGEPPKQEWIDSKVSLLEPDAV